MRITGLLHPFQPPVLSALLADRNGGMLAIDANLVVRYLVVDGVKVRARRRPDGSQICLPDWLG